MRRHALMISAAALLVFATLALPAGGLPPQFEKSPTAKDYPHADVVVLSESRAYTLDASGLVSEKVHLIEKILTYQGMDMVGDPKVDFNREAQDLKIVMCRTYMPEGKTVSSQANAFNEMTPFELERAPAYTAWRQMVVTKVGLDVNAVIETEYSIADKKPWRRFLEGVESLQGEFPALEREVSVAVPDGVELKYRLFNSDVQPAVKKETGKTVYTWTLKNVPGSALAAHASEVETGFMPTLVYTTCPSWARQASDVGGLVEKAVAATTPALEKKTDELVKGIESPFERILKVQGYVAESINGVEWPLADFDFSPRAAGDVYDGGYGHALDKAVLLCAMLKRAGVDAAIAACRRTVDGSVDPAAVPCLAQMDRIIVHADLNKGTLWLDPTEKLSESSQRDFLGFKGLPLVKGMAELHTMPAVEGGDLLAADLEAKADKDLGLEGSGLVACSGYYSPFYEVQGSKDSQKEWLEGFVSSVLPGAKLTDFSIVRMEPGAVVFKAEFKAAPPKTGNVKMRQTGIPNRSLIRRYPLSHLMKRDLPLVLASPGQEKITLKITLAEGEKPSCIPAEAKISNPAGSLDQTWTFKDGTLAMELDAKVPSRVIGVADYPGFREIYGLANSMSTRAVIF